MGKPPLLQVGKGAVGDEALAVVAVEAVLGAEPNEASSILLDGKDRALGETFWGRDATDLEVAGDDEARQQEDRDEAPKPQPPSATATLPNRSPMYSRGSQPGLPPQSIKTSPANDMP